MNELTKEELEDLYLSYRTFCTEDGTQEMRQLTNFENGILDKLQSLIDNYCEHEFIMNMHDAEWHCYKCGVLQ